MPTTFARSRNHAPAALLALSLGGLLAACSGTDSTGTFDPGSNSPSIAGVVTASYKSAVTISTSGSSLVLRSSGVPDHLTPYWSTSNALYEPQIAGHHLTPGNLQSQTFVMTIPTNPAAASSKEATSLGPIGMALNGVAIYNDREGGNVPVDAGTLLSFDRGGAHSGPGGLYHYHFTGDFTSKDDSNLIGFLRDGFPIYGRRDADGSYPADLDSNGGHVGTTSHFSTAIYHYHASNVNYMNSGYFILKAGSYHGSKGSFTS